MAALTRIIVPVLKPALWALLGAVVVLLLVFILLLERRPDLSVWHTTHLDEEFTADSPVTRFTEYLALEERLFQQLEAEVYAQTATPSEPGINRYQRGSLADPDRWSPDGNRSYILQAQAPTAAVLLLHGLSDAPYSLHGMGRRLHAAGASVLGLRIPGHGTIPAGLLRVTWQDMAAAVDLAVGHLAELAPGLPIHIVGYSNGAALAVHHVLVNLDDPNTPAIARLVLLSPEIGVTPAAALAVWQARLGRLLGMEKLAWNDILPEYEPFKYGSFAVNAGDVSYRITREIQRELTRLEGIGRLGEVPPILAFSSVVDATVNAPALVSNLFNRLRPGENELVLFDINRQAGIESLLRWQPDAMLSALQQSPRDSFALTLVTNRDRQSAEVVARHWRADTRQFDEETLGLLWPDDVHSLSHVALPFAPEDPLYGGHPATASPGIHLGNIAMHGERGTLAISEAALLRLRWNPFYAYLESRSLAFLGLP